VPDLRNPRDPLKPFEQEASIAFFPTKFLSTKTKGKEPYLNELLLKICAIAGCKETDGPLKECVKNFTEASTKQLQCIVLYKNFTEVCFKICPLETRQETTQIRCTAFTTCKISPSSSSSSSSASLSH
jgi:hypothetical protein